MALLETGRLDPKQQFICHKLLRIGSAQLDCTHPAEVRQLDAEEAIAYSCNSYFAQVASRLSASEFVELLRRAGFATPPGLRPPAPHRPHQFSANTHDAPPDALGSPSS